MYPEMALPMEGRTNWKVFAGVMAGGVAGIGALTGMLMNGVVSAAVNLPVPFTVQASSINGTGFNLAPGQVPNQQQGAAQIQMSGSLQNMTISKTVNTPLGTFQINISAGSGSTPVQATGMTVYASSLGGDTSFPSGLTMDASSGALSGSQLQMNNATLQVPYLSTQSITLPGMSLSIQPVSGSSSSSSSSSSSGN
ncbi:hypothetical protein IW967_02675 [Alicyclobacillus mali]|uniref:SipW-cognate class signal peptide n=1 Tax=Alicyclobacillus mali (ex Roth et al. 2021) TaxID=1123961 RepID=A0ABS0F0G8_9BACL|nr:DUF6230 family protein [Alicyclobacillus mali (ex Roth et al. 2021)]MBF8376780.1 hypothetical protein [Alicyclobacillus mali (ex Roth et al. 2021)]